LTDLEVFKESAHAMCSAPSSPRWLHPNLAMGNKIPTLKLKCLAIRWTWQKLHLLDAFKCFCHWEKVDQLWKSLSCDLTTKHSVCV